MYHVAICEDEAHLRLSLEEQCRQALNELEVEAAVSLFSSAEALEQAMQTRSFDLLLLDIMLGGQSGLDLARTLRGTNDRVSIIFISGCEEYLREGYSVQPVQFLVKPVEYDALLDAIRTDWRLNHMKQRILFEESCRSTILPASDVLYIESLNHGIVVHLTQEDLSLRLSLTDTVQMLPPGCFCRCHNSFVVNLAKVERICRSEVVLQGGIRVPIGRKYYAAAQSALIRYINQ